MRDQVVFTPRRLVGQRELEVAQVDFGVGVELLLRRAVPVEAAPAFAGQLRSRRRSTNWPNWSDNCLRLKLNEAASFVGRAVGVNFQEVRLAPQGIDDGPPVVSWASNTSDIGCCQAICRPEAVAVKLAASNCPCHFMPCCSGRLLSATCTWPELISTCSPQPQRGRQQPGQPGEVHLAA